ncbi:sigma-70 family RNA polymerase sigma factor [Radiobacillus sp. PE A8.2]|uniref:sigma-70 family RNA polymerase sigma factor n=1 Tax=Radiobacillus sp. PE A8.2 TaxID=3380349 RepID=UPI00388E5066
MDNYFDPAESIDKMSKDEAIEWIMDTHGEKIKRFIYTYVKNRSQTDDLFQDVLFAVYRQLHTFKQQSSFKTWLYRIAANKCKDYLRSPIHRLIIWKAQVIERADDRTPEQSLMLDEQKQALLTKMLQLPIKYREVLILQYYQEFSINEISELLGINPSTVKTRIMRAKEKLKDELKEDFLYE